MKKRILIVEGDAGLMKVYKTLLRNEGARWDILTAASAVQARRFLDHDVFDAVVTELRLPGDSGTDLINEVRNRSPRTTRIILSDICDQEEVARCLNAIHQFIPRPFEAQALKAALDRIGGLDAYLEDPKLKNLVGRLGALPSFPTLYVDIMRELRGIYPSVENVAAIIARDPAMTAKLLQITNSAVLGLARPISRPMEAVQFLGLATVRALALSAHIFSRFERATVPGFVVDELWRHSLKCGQIARMIATNAGASADDADDAGLAGMLHDLGKLMLADSLPDDFAAALKLAGERRIPLHEAELEVFGATHGAVAAYLLGLWGLPVAVVEAVAFHQTPRSSAASDFGPLTAVHVANVLEHELSRTQSGGRAEKFDLKYLASLGVEEKLEAWRAEALKRFRPEE